MTTPAELESKFWKELRSDMTMMVGLNGVEDGHAQPMTAFLDTAKTGQESGPIWFFTAADNGLVRELREGNRAIATFASKGHGIFASVHGRLSIDNDRGVIDRLWNPFVAARFKGGKSDTKLTLLRLDAERAEIWENASSLVAGVKLLFGSDPKKDYRDKVAEVSLS
jgi:general stress protein 26